jgi:hypothetical protein
MQNRSFRYGVKLRSVKTHRSRQQVCVLECGYGYKLEICDVVTKMGMIKLWEHGGTVK